VKGYVSATLLDGAGHRLPTSVAQEKGPTQFVQLAPGAAARFFLRFGNPLAGDQPCYPPHVTKVAITPPGGGAITANAPDGGIDACNGKVSTGPLSSTS
jgi:hypothetical protein